MDERATGIILRTRPLTETSLIVNWLTLEAGRVSTVAKGARKSKSPFAGKLDLYFDAEFSFARSARSALHNLREVKVLSTRSNLRNDIERLDAAAKATRRIEKMTEEDTPIPELFELFRSFIDELAAGPFEASVLPAFECKALSILGLDPQMEGQGLNAGEARALAQLRDSDFAAARRIKLSPAQAGAIAHFLERQFRDAY